MKYESVAVMPSSETPWRESAGHREGNYRRQSFTVTDPEAGIHLRPSAAIYEPGSYSPRHRHNFEQIRFNIDGEVVFGKQTFGPGTCVYFPESVHYGPTERRNRSTLGATLQFPGPSGAAFFTGEDTSRATQELRAQGATFQMGVCHWPDGRKQDGYEAVWEHLAGEKLKYAPPRYQDPVFLHSGSFPWESAGSGVSVKHLAYFNECGPNVSLVHLEAGSSTPGGMGDCMQVRYVIDGDLEYAGQSCGAVSCLYYPPGVAHEGMLTREGATVLVIQLRAPGGQPPPLDAI